MKKQLAALVFLSITLLISGFLIFSADSLAGYIGAFVAFTAYFICMIKPPYKTLIASVLTALVLVSGLVAINVPSTRERIISEVYGTESTIQARAIWWLAATDMATERPLTGFGPAGYASAYYSYEPPLGRQTRFTRQVAASHPHNEFIRVAAELGIPGLIFYIMLLAVPVFTSYGAVKDSDPLTKPAGYALWCGFLAFIVHSAFDVAPLHSDFALPFWILLGLLASASRWTSESPQKQCYKAHNRKSKSPRFLIPALCAVLALSAFWYWWEWGLKSYSGNLKLLRVKNTLSALIGENGESPVSVSSGKAGVILRKSSTQLQEASQRLLIPHEKLINNLRLGRAFLIYGFSDSAFKHLSLVNDEAPGMTYVDGLLGLTYFEQGKKRKAGTHLKRHLKKYPDETLYYRYLWAIDRTSAMQILSQKVFNTDNVSYPRRVHLLGRFFAETGNWQDLRHLVNGVEESGHSQSIQQMGRLLRQLRDISAAAGIEDEITRLEHEYPEFFEDRL